MKLVDGGCEGGGGQEDDGLGCFGTLMEGIPGVHASGHFAIGGLAVDAFASAGDPAFYLHHAQVDRVWTLWQNIKAQRKRTRQVYGTSTAFNGEFIFYFLTFRRFILTPFPSRKKKGVWLGKLGDMIGC